MKNSIGSLAALAAFAAPALLEAVPLPPPAQSAAFSNVVLPNGSTLSFDIDGDSTLDFSLLTYSNGIYIDISALGSNHVTLEPVIFGDLFSGEATHQITSIDTTVFTNGYYGFSFISGTSTHNAWVYFDFGGDDKLVVNGGWQTIADESVTVGSAIPEPSTVAAIAGATALLGTLALRRRRLPVAEADIAPTA